MFASSHLGSFDKLEVYSRFLDGIVVSRVLVPVADHLEVSFVSVFSFLKKLV